MSTKRKTPSRSPRGPQPLAATGPTVESAAPADEVAPSRRGRLLRRLALIVATTLYTVGVLLVPYAASNSVFIYSMYALLAAATLVFVPASRPKAIGHFGLVWVISLIASPSWVVLVLVVGHSWATCTHWAPRSEAVPTPVRPHAAA